MPSADQVPVKSTASPMHWHMWVNVRDNAAMESFFSSLKTERTARKNYRSRDEADVFDYIERLQTPKRRQSTIGYMSPMEFERQARLA
jgi:putative transposase